MNCDTFSSFSFIQEDIATSLNRILEKLTEYESSDRYHQTHQQNFGSQRNFFKRECEQVDNLITLDDSNESDCDSDVMVIEEPEVYKVSSCSQTIPDSQDYSSSQEKDKFSHPWKTRLLFAEESERYIEMRKIAAARRRFERKMDQNSYSYRESMKKQRKERKERKERKRKREKARSHQHREHRGF